MVARQTFERLISRISRRRAAIFLFRLRLTLIISFTVYGFVGCSLEHHLQREGIGDLGYFEFRKPRTAMTGIVIGAAHGRTDPESIEYAKWISDQTGAGIVTAFGFKAKRLAVAQPLVRFISYGTLSEGPMRRGSIYPEFKKLLQQTAQRRLKFYVGIRFSPQASNVSRIETATGGFTFEELQALKRSYLEIRDGMLRDTRIPRVAMAIDPLDTISWPISGVKHHGVLMNAERGLSLRLPQTLSTLGTKELYREILSRWVFQIIRMVRENPSKLPRLTVKLMDYGRLERIPSRKQRTGIVVGAPHGTFDEYTAEIANEICFRTGLPAVIAKGFTPTEGSGWRINVNRPTERRYPSGEIEIETERASEVYREFRQAVLTSAEGSLRLYIDIHQNGRQQNIEVATVGISKEQALTIKKEYHQVRDRVLRSNPDVEAVDLVIEPIDSVDIGAWAAKASGILSVAHRSLHFELPAYRVLRSSRSREAYTQILAALLERTADLTATSEAIASRLAIGAGERPSPPFPRHLGEEIAENKAREQN